MFLLAGSFLERLIQWDHSLFQLINQRWTNPVSDAIMPIMRTSTNWIPLYLFILVFMLLNFRLKGLWWAVFFLATIAITDMVGHYAFKIQFERDRPCNDPMLLEHVRLLIKNCGNGYSFISNHAANHFGMATFFFITFHHISRIAAWVALVWAFLIAYAQVYTGVHFPLDIITGGLVGVAFGYITGSFFNKRFGIAIFDDQLVA